MSKSPNPKLHSPNSIDIYKITTKFYNSHPTGGCCIVVRWVLRQVRFPKSELLEFLCADSKTAQRRRTRSSAGVRSIRGSDDGGLRQRASPPGGDSCPQRATSFRRRTTSGSRGLSMPLRLKLRLMKIWLVDVFRLDLQEKNTIWRRCSDILLLVFYRNDSAQLHTVFCPVHRPIKSIILRRKSIRTENELGRRITALVKCEYRNVNTLKN